MAKKSAPLPKVYFDACVFLSIIEGTPDRLPACLALAEAAERGELEVYTSTFSIAEVAFGKMEKDAKTLDPAVEAKIDAFWEIGSPFKLIEPHRLIMESAKAMVRDAMAAGLKLTPPDAVHIASAKSLAIPRVITYDTYKDKRDDLKKLLGIDLCDPPKPNPLLFPDPSAS